MDWAGTARNILASQDLRGLAGSGRREQAEAGTGGFRPCRGWRVMGVLAIVSV